MSIEELGNGFIGYVDASGKSGPRWRIPYIVSYCNVDMPHETVMENAVLHGTVESADNATVVCSTSGPPFYVRGHVAAQIDAAIGNYSK